MAGPRTGANPLLLTLAALLAACGGPASGRAAPDSGHPPPLQARPPDGQGVPAVAQADDAAGATTGEADAPSTAAPASAGGIGPLTDAQRQALHAPIPGEDLAEWEVHYIKSNEARHDVWFPYVADLAGAFVGVGSDQNYTVLAAQKAEFAFLLDIDPRVADLHHVYEVLIEASEDPETLHARWHADYKDESIALLEQAFAGADESQRKRYLREYRAARETVWRHLRHVIDRDREGRETSWLSNPDYYAHVRTMYLNDRIRILAGDLTGPQTLRGFGELARRLGVPVRVLYLSNAEEYFMYTPQYRENVRALVGDERSLVLRTIYNKQWEHADSLWNYQVQPLLDFQTRLEDKLNAGRNAMLRYAERRDAALERTTDVKGLSRLGMRPAESGS